MKSLVANAQALLQTKDRNGMATKGFITID